MCDIRILIPIKMRIIPPISSVLLPNKLLALLPRNTPKTEKTAQVIPIMILGSSIGFCNTPKLNPTARASMFVASDKRIRGNPFDGSLLKALPSLLKDPLIIRIPINDSSVNAIQ